MEGRPTETFRSIPFRFALRVKENAFHLLGRLAHSPALIAYLAVGTVAAFFQEGARGLLCVAVNLPVLGFFAVLIRMMTEKRPARATPVRRPKIELAAGLALFLLFLGCCFLLFRLTGLPVLQPAFDRFVKGAYALSDHLILYGLPYWVASPLGNAFVTIPMELLPTVILFAVFGYGPRQMGLRPRCWKLTAVLLGLTALAGLTAKSYIPLYSEPIGQTAVSFLIMLFINGFPEELFFRGFLLPRFERVLGSNTVALVVTSILFGAIHIPSNIANESLSFALLNVVSVSFPSGLLWGYLYQRTRSVIPGMLFHTSFGLLGGYFLSI